MLRTIGAGVTALLLTASPLAYAQTPSAGAPERSSAEDWVGLTDARIEITKAALQLTPDQEKILVSRRGSYSQSGEEPPSSRRQGRRTAKRNARQEPYPSVA